jgi:ribonuclease PH
MRPSGRATDHLREISLELGYAPQAEGSCLIRSGNTHVLCTATVQERVPPFLRNSGRGWVTAEYGMLPRATDRRTDREAARGRQSGRTQEIQRLIGRSLRAVTDLRATGERQVVLDCDVLRADGGTRTAAITGAYVALHQAFQGLVDAGELPALPLREPVAAVACGIVDDEVRLDLDYAEDSTAQADANFVLSASGRLVEVQFTAEDVPLERDQFVALLDLAEAGVRQLVGLQRQALGLDA